MIVSKYFNIDGKCYVEASDYDKLLYELKHSNDRIAELEDKINNLRARCHKYAIDNFENGNYAGLFIVKADRLKNDDKVKELQCELDKTYNQLMEVEKEAQEQIEELEKTRSDWVDNAVAWKEKFEKAEKEIKELESELEVKENLLKIKNGLCGNNDELPIDPMEAAQMLINSTYKYELSALEKALYKRGDTRTTERYSIDDLEQIAEHLLVYCKHHREDEE